MWDYVSEQWTNGPIVHPQMMIVWRATVEWHWQIKQENPERTCPSATLSTTNPIWTEPGENLGLRGEKSATNRLTHGTAKWHTQLDETRKIWTRLLRTVRNSKYDVLKPLKHITKLSVLYLTQKCQYRCFKLYFNIFTWPRLILKPYIPCCENDNNNYISNDFYTLVWLQHQTRFGLRRPSSMVY
jgi:hypothetical protein